MLSLYMCYYMFKKKICDAMNRKRWRNLQPKSLRWKCWIETCLRQRETTHTRNLCTKKSNNNTILHSEALFYPLNASKKIKSAYSVLQWGIITKTLHIYDKAIRSTLSTFSVQTRVRFEWLTGIAWWVCCLGSVNFKHG